MVVEKISYDDTLRQGTDKINKAIDQANLAEKDSKEALTKANDSMALSEQTSLELNQAILTGDSSPLSGQLSVGADGTVYEGPQNRFISEYDNVNKRITEAEQIQADDIKNVVIAEKPLVIPTYDGSYQTTHPSIYFSANGWNGYRYWMAHTPYPLSNDDYENPSIVVSNDGYEWIEPPGIINPIVPPPSDVTSGGHLSDVHLVMVNNVLECWYRRNPALEGQNRANNDINMIYRTKSSDGITWSEPEFLFQDVGGAYKYFSPVVMYDGKYKFWFSTSGSKFYYMESTDALTWTTPTVCNLPTPNHFIWHQDIQKTDLGYEMFYCGYYIGDQMDTNKLFYSKSSDGINWDAGELIAVAPKPYSRRNVQQLYRPCFLKLNGFYKVYISAMLETRQWYIYLSQGYNPKALTGYEGYGFDNLTLYRNAQLKFGQEGIYARDFFNLTASNGKRVRGRVDSNGRIVFDDGTSVNITALLAQLILGNTTLQDNDIKLLNPGVSEVHLKAADKAHTMKINGGQDGNQGFLEIAGLYLNNSRWAEATEGAFRYNLTLKKLQYHDGTGWKNLAVES